MAQFLIFALEKTIKMKIFLFAFSLFTLSSVFAQEAKDTKSQAILDKLSAKMKGLKSFYVEFSEITKNSAGASETELGKGWVKGDKFYAIYGDITVLSNGLKTWSIIKEDKSVYESVAAKDDDNSINPKRLMTIWEKDFKNYFEKEETVGKEVMNVIKLVPTNPKKADYHTILIYVSKTDGQLKKAVMRFKNGTTKTYTLTNFTENASVDDSKFVYDAKKYPGYTVVKD